MMEVHLEVLLVHFMNQNAGLRLLDPRRGDKERVLEDVVSECAAE